MAEVKNSSGRIQNSGLIYFGQISIQFTISKQQFNKLSTLESYVVHQVKGRAKNKKGGRFLSKVLFNLSKLLYYRVFACMNPATDVGKKELPDGLRNRFTEYFIEEPNNEQDLLLIVQDYLKNLAPTLDLKIFKQVTRKHFASHSPEICH